MQIDIITLFPQGLRRFLAQSILGKAQQKGRVLINLHNLRGFAKDKRKTVDGRPYGGGAGMILRADVIVEAIEAIKCSRLTVNSSEKRNTVNHKLRTNKPYVILLDPKGKLFTQKKAQDLSQKDWLILVCGHYEGVDARVANFVDEIISIGDYILAGGEAAALVIVDAIVRLLPGVLKKREALAEESFQPSFIKPAQLASHKLSALLEYPQYTKPRNFKGLEVPEILFSGNQKEILKWRKREAIRQTQSQRPDLFQKLKKGQKD
jgi:tRNA (guanine37-N1)-methyltransferase